MKPVHLRIVGIGLSLMLVLALGILWIGQVNATPPAAEFAPTYDRHAADARVRAAQAEHERLRDEGRLTTDATVHLPFVPTVYFPQTGHHLSNRSGFLDFWRANGQTLIFGYPITEEIIENGRVVQYFERARMEYHAEHAGTALQVQLGLLGRELLSQDQFGPVADPLNGTRYFVETGHTLGHYDFRGFWERRGGLSHFGYPISEMYEENGRQVQWFERARFEYHPEDLPGFYQAQQGYTGLDLDSLHEVRLTHLGRWVADARGINTAPAAPIPGVPTWSPALWSRSIEINLSTQWLTAYEDGLPVYYAPVATGRPAFATPPGNFAIYDKLHVQTMNGSAGGETWNVPNVPWVMYIHGGVALHGTYWHNSFGANSYRPSHGCINLGIDDAQWLYEWADIGVPVNVHY